MTKINGSGGSPPSGNVAPTDEPNVDQSQKASDPDDGGSILGGMRRLLDGAEDVWERSGVEDDFDNFVSGARREAAEFADDAARSVRTLRNPIPPILVEPRTPEQVQRATENIVERMGEQARPVVERFQMGARGLEQLGDQYLQPLVQAEQRFAQRLDDVYDRFDPPDLRDALKEGSDFAFRAIASGANSALGGIPGFMPGMPKPGVGDVLDVVHAVADPLAELGLAVAEEVADRRSQIHDFIDEGEDITNGLLSRVGERADDLGLPPEFNIFRLASRATDDLARVAHGVTDVTAQVATHADDIRNAIDLLDPDQHGQILDRMNPGQSLIIDGRGSIEVHKGVGGKLGAGGGMKVSRSADDPSVYNVEYHGLISGQIGVGVNAQNQGGSLDLSGGLKGTQKFEFRLPEDEQVMLELIHSTGSGVMPPSIAQNPDQYLTEMKLDTWTGVQGDLKLLGGLDVELRQKASPTIKNDPETGEKSLAVGFGYELRKSVGTDYLQVPEALREPAGDLSAQAMNLGPGGQLLAQMPPEAIDTFQDAYGPLAGANLLGTVGVTVTPEIPVDGRNILEASTVTVAGKGTVRVGTNEFEVEAKAKFKNLDELAARIDIDHQQLVAALSDGRMTPTELRMQIETEGFDLDDYMDASFEIVEKRTDGFRASAFKFKAGAYSEQEAVLFRRSTGDPPSNPNVDFPADVGELRERMHLDDQWLDALDDAQDRLSYRPIKG